MSDYKFYEVAKLWLPDENMGVVKVASFANEDGYATLHFDDEYNLCISKETLLNLKYLINETVDALEGFEKFSNFTSKSHVKENPDNVLEFKRKDDD